MEVVKLFLEEVTRELMYNIVHDNNIITRLKLCDEFKRKTGHEPMGFYGFVDDIGHDWLDFINSIPGLKLCGQTIIKCDEESIPCVFKMFNTAYMDEIAANKSCVAEYREKLLMKCCDIMKRDFADLDSCKDTNGNTPLHFLGALPGITYDCDTLAKYLLQAGVDPLAENDNGQTFLHIVFGRFTAKFDNSGALCFTNERMATTKWLFEDQKAVTDLVSEELSRVQITSLVKAQDTVGNTLLHEWALSATSREEYIQERRICTQLLKLGASLRVQNSTGEAPLHYAYKASVFKIFVLKGAVCRARNDRDEAPVLFILKMSVELAFAETSASTELEDQVFIQTTNRRSVEKAVELLENLTSIVAENTEARETIFIPDIKGNVAIDIVLIAIRMGSYELKGIKSNMAELRSSLMELLSEMLRNASASDMRWQNKKGQSFLHVLLDMQGDDNQHMIIKGAYILHSLEILLEHNADVNAADSEGCTPLDIVHKHYGNEPVLYQKCSQMLIENGANAKRDLGNDCGLAGRICTLGIHKETRKLRSCPKRHLNCAERLTDSKSGVAVVGKYRYFNQDSIGSGAFSAIFVALKDENVDGRTGVIDCRAYALKRLDKAKINPKDIKREITTLLSISGKCENIIQCYESFDDSFFQYLCLDLMDGDLHAFVANDGVCSILGTDPAITVKVTKEIINGLAFLHRQEFIHRDLKPGNILYTTDPTLHFKIADFGLTKNISSLSTMTSTRGFGMVPGTRCWMAPELVSMNSREHTQQSDIFSLGLVLHYLITMGKHPFATENEEATHVIERKIAEMQIHFDVAIHPEAASFLQVLLIKDPSKRPPAAYLNQHPYLWSSRKKIEFLKAVGDQPEAVNPLEARHVNSPLEKRLQKTRSGQEARIVSWDQFIESLFIEMTNAWRSKKYRTDKVIDLIRFIRNAYAHKQERSLRFQQDLDNNIFLREFPFLVLNVFGVVQQLRLDEQRGNIFQALSL